MEDIAVMEGPVIVTDMKKKRWTASTATAARAASMKKKPSRCAVR